MPTSFFTPFNAMGTHSEFYVNSCLFFISDFFVSLLPSANNGRTSDPDSDPDPGAAGSDGLVIGCKVCISPFSHFCSTGLCYRVTNESHELGVPCNYVIKLLHWKTNVSRWSTFITWLSSEVPWMIEFYTETKFLLRKNVTDEKLNSENLYWRTKTWLIALLNRLTYACGLLRTSVNRKNCLEYQNTV